MDIEHSQDRRTAGFGSTFRSHRQRRIR